MISRINSSENQNLAAGINEVKRMLPTDPVDCDARTNDNVLITLSSGIPWDECSPIAKAIRGVHSNSVHTMAVCMQNRCRETRCLRQAVVSSHRYFFPRISDFSSVLHKIECMRNSVEPAPNSAKPDVINVTVKQVSIVEHLAEGLEYIPDSTVPAAHWSEENRTLTWPIYDFIPKDGVTLRYRTKPLGNGNIKISKGAEIRWRDNQNLEGASILPPTSVLVLGGMKPDE